MFNIHIFISNVIIIGRLRHIMWSRKWHDLPPYTQNVMEWIHLLPIILGVSPSSWWACSHLTWYNGQQLDHSIVYIIKGFYSHKNEANARTPTEQKPSHSYCPPDLLMYRRPKWTITYIGVSSSSCLRPPKCLCSAKDLETPCLGLCGV
jgi:hypothetical protein